MQEYQIHFINSRYRKPNIAMNILLSRAAETEIRIITFALLNFMHIKLTSVTHDILISATVKLKKKNVHDRRTLLFLYSTKTQIKLF